MYILSDIQLHILLDLVRFVGMKVVCLEELLVFLFVRVLGGF
jgi:hypothetical protein